jgi:uroporphyrin-III C-methyltransferase / precorrin-2 dehydrogenase / sirohydrochlorin ferrochelatase
MSATHHRSWPHPIFLDLTGQPVVVIGGGAVAERKVEALVASGACITVVSPEVTDLIAQRAAEGSLTLQLRPYRSGDLAGCRLAYAATSNTVVNQAVRDEARDAGIWLNAVDMPALCDFITPATVRRGHLTLAVSTNGRCPELAKEIRKSLERAYGPEYAELVDEMGEAREREKAGQAPAAPEFRTAAGIVYLVGAGPGDPELLTIKGRRLLGLADTVVYDALVDPRLLDFCQPSAARLYAGKRSGGHSRSQEEINALLVAEASAGRTVVRLKGGDPFMFGRGGEEAEALVDAGIAFEVVPGVSSGFAAPAYAGIPLTHRGVAAEVVFLTGHDSPASPSPVDWARYAASPATLVVFMGLDNLRAIAGSLLEYGRDARCPVAVITHGTTDAQQTVVAPLADIADRAAEAGVEAPALIVVGEVVGLRDRLQWFEPGFEGGPPSTGR